MDAAEQVNLQANLALLADAGVAVTLADVDVTDFRDEGILGMFKDGRVLVAKKTLANRSESLLVVIHEVAHKTSRAGDGSKGHVEEIERIWCAVTTHLMSKLDN
jgi:hypothetical protein